MVPSTELSGCSARDSNSARCQLRSITTETIAIPITTTTAATTVITRPTITRDRRRLGGTAVTSVAGIVMVTSSADGILGRAHQSPPADSSLSQRARRGQRTRFQRLRAREARRRYVGSIALTANASGPPPTERAVPRPLYTCNTGIRSSSGWVCLAPTAIPEFRHHKRRDSSPTTFTSSGGETGDE